MEGRITPKNITKLEKKEVFVFGSNESGIHGAGAARQAHMQFGARWANGFGMTSDKTFAIPTKDWNIQTLSEKEIAFYVRRFIDFAKNHPEMKFLVTEIACGLAGYEPRQIAPMFLEAVELQNVYLPQRFWEELLKEDLIIIK